LRTVVSSEVAALCLVIFLADVVAGIIMPTFSLFARDVGLSLALLGALNTLGGVTQLAASLPLGVVSDRVGRTRVITGGLLLFAASMLAFSVADGAGLIALGRVLQGVAVIATFQIGAAYLGDITPPGRRAVAFGSYTTAMGLGFTVGPLIGGQIAERWDARVSYAVAAAIALLGALLARQLLHESPAHAPSARGAWLANVGLLARRHDLALVSIGNLLVSFTFAGPIATFLPLYARGALIAEATIGTLFAIRALVSAAGRVPNSVVTRRVGNLPILLGALMLQSVVMFGIAGTTDVVWLAVLLSVDGLAFGAYLVAGQTWVADHTEAAYRGAAVGLYAAAGSVGGIAAPLALGLVAERWGVETVFVVNGWFMLLGSVGFLAGTLAIVRRGRMATAQAGVTQTGHQR
jgi:MFS family permease